MRWLSIIMGSERPSKARQWAVVLLLWVLSAVLLPVPAAHGASRETTLKLAYLVNFARFVYWPDDVFSDADDSIDICFVGDDALADELEQVSGVEVQGRPIAVSVHAPISSFANCDIIYFPEAVKRRVPEIMARIDRRYTLTVGDTRDFTRVGGIIGLVPSGGKLRFEISLSARDRAGLQFSSQLMELATLVE